MLPHFDNRNYLSLPTGAEKASPLGGDESAQLKNNKINFRDAPRCLPG